MFTFGRQFMFSNGHALLILINRRDKICDSKTLVYTVTNIEIPRQLTIILFGFNKETALSLKVFLLISH